jgi:hypothetical protein
MSPTGNRYGSVQPGVVSTVGHKQSGGCLAAEERCCKHIGGSEKSNVRPGADIGVDAGIQRWIELPDRDFLGYRGVTARRNVCIIVDRGE